jgi:hypothetical protein
MPFLFIAKTLSHSVFGAYEVTAEGFRNADILSGQIGSFYNFIYISLWLG